MSPTRLLVLGVVRFAQPVHGYEVRRELLSWQLEEVTHVKPGSIYSALKTLERDALIAVVDEQRGSAVGRTVYRLTKEGEKEFQRLLRKAWWSAELAAEPLVPALSMLTCMPRPELLAALDSRIEQLGARERQWAFLQATVRGGATGADGEIPEHVREILMFLRGRTRAELDWVAGFQQRLREGAYRLDGEPPAQDSQPV